MPSLAERFARFVQKSDGCWLWTGAKKATGYGFIRVVGVGMRGAHRIAYELANGPIPEGMVVRHTCDNPRCVRPDHLIVGTVADNVRDCAERGRRFHQRGYRRPLKATCKRGHPMTPENTYSRPGRIQHRTCRICTQMSRERYDAKKAG